MHESNVEKATYVDAPKWPTNNNNNSKNKLLGKNLQKFCNKISMFINTKLKHNKTAIFLEVLNAGETLFYPVRIGEKTKSNKRRGK